MLGFCVLVLVMLEDVCGMLFVVLCLVDLVVIFEYVLLFNVEGELDGEVVLVDIVYVVVCCVGKDVSLVIYGGLLLCCVVVVDVLVVEGIDVEVLDLCMLWLLDVVVIVISVGSMYCLVVVDEGWKIGSLVVEVIVVVVE